MNVQTSFVAEPADRSKGGKLGSFDMSAIPDVGDTVQLGGVDYAVVSRAWQPKKLLAPHVTIMLRQLSP
jgi:hypothetical protein